MTELIVGAGIVAFVVLVVAVLAWIVARKVPSTPEQPLGPLALPKGSVRAILGLLIVGEFVNFLLFGWEAFGKDTTNFTAVLSAFATLTGAVTGFYFGSRASTENKPSTPQAPAAPGAPPHP